MRNTMENCMCQKYGRENDFMDYKLTVFTPIRCYTMINRKEASKDFNKFLEI